MDFPAKCNHCNQPLFGPVKYCPFCGTEFLSGTSEKQKLDSLRSAIDDSLVKGEFTPDVGTYIKKKGKELGIAEEVCNSFLLEVLKEKKFIPKKESPHDPLSVCWYSAGKKEVPPKPKKPVEVKQPVSMPTEPDTIPPTVTSFSIPSTSTSLSVAITNFEATDIGGTVAAFAVTETPAQPLASDTRWSVSKPTIYPFTSAGTHTLYAWAKDNSNNVSSELKSATVTIMLPQPKPIFLKVVLVLGIVVIIGGFFYAKKGSFMQSVSKTEQGEIKPQPIAEQPKEAVREVVEPPKPQAEQGNSQQPAPATNLNEEREKIRQEAEREALAKVEAEKQRQEQALRQREIDSYLSDGKRFFENGKYELCIEKMREVIKRDNNNPEAKQYIRMASERINNIKRQFSNPTFGGSE
ncbi:MAG: hypothetical protein AB1480_08140 [Nitrospirota bacterium]